LLPGSSGAASITASACAGRMHALVLLVFATAMLYVRSVGHSGY
jgi:hypothetical protein